MVGKMPIKKFFCSWSGGKDSCYAFIQAAKSMQPQVLLNMMNENGMVSRSHAIPKAILEKQAEMLNLPIITKPASWEAYENIFIDTLREIKNDFDINAGVFGDIDLQPHRDWEEKVCRAVDVETVLVVTERLRMLLNVERIARQFALPGIRIEEVVPQVLKRRTVEV